ncbi:potassium channel family protein [Alistipes sp. ZOR0009]|jgi:trk system potassium uptake protein TrkA|uniref:potassium channel family protein n=1 Tax=Alistipes sp. ZOR0009 TaxID=1339253 RepID=UPI000647CA4D|nr:TrkA family potassium uptake protein [Alistipes sp. ZOR0009]
MKFIIIGLGNYGSALAERLTSMGHEVIGVDSNTHRIEELKSKITSTISMDINEVHMLKVLPLKDADAVVVAIGENVGASILVSAELKQLKVNKLISRAISTLHTTVLEAIGVDEVITPEKDSAEDFALQLDVKGYKDSYAISNQHRILSMTVPSIIVGQAVGELSLGDKFNIKLVTIIRKEYATNFLGAKSMTEKVVHPVGLGTVIEKEDTLVLFGDISNIQNFTNFYS